MKKDTEKKKRSTCCFRVCCLLYADDIMVSALTEKNCEEASIIVCNILVDAGFKASKEKLQWVKQKFSCLCHVLMPGLRKNLHRSGWTDPEDEIPMNCVTAPKFSGVNKLLSLMETWVCCPWRTFAEHDWSQGIACITDMLDWWSRDSFHGTETRHYCGPNSGPSELCKDFSPACVRGEGCGSGYPLATTRLRL